MNGHCVCRLSHARPCPVHGTDFQYEVVESATNSWPMVRVSEPPQAVVDTALLEGAIETLLVAIGEDPNREGLRDTPRRVAAFWKEFIEFDPGKCDTIFQESRSVDQMVVVSGIRVWSLCEHHLLPFWMDVSIGYIAATRVLGLSKFARIAQKHAHRLQIQERYVHDVASEIKQLITSNNVAVLAEGEHLCLTARGARSGHLMSSSAIFGAFRQEGPAREEFMLLASRREGTGRAR